jgi:hypothetical protein
MASLGYSTAWRELLKVANLEVPEADLDDITSLVLCDGTHLVTTYSEWKVKY